MDRTPSIPTTRRGPRRRLPEDQSMVVVRVSADDKAWLEAHAGANDRTVADQIRRWIRFARGRQQVNMNGDILDCALLSPDPAAAIEPTPDR